MAVIGLVTQLIGTGLSVVGQMKQAKAMKAAEAARQRQMQLDAQRQRRDIIRNSIMARATALSSATNQGAIGGSALQGGYGQIQGQSGNQLLANSQNETLGNRIFKANKDYYNASVLTDLGAGLSSLGGMFMQNAGTIQRVGTAGYFG